MSVQVGQIWASTHPQDVRTGDRQHRTVTSVTATHAYLRTEGSPRKGSSGVRMRNGRVPGHVLLNPRPNGSAYPKAAS